MIALFTFIAPADDDFGTGDKILLPILFFVLCILFSLPVIPIVKNGGLITLTKSTGKTFSKIVSVFYSAVFIWTAIISTARFSLFMSTVMFGSENIIFMTIIFTAAAATAATRGTETLGRVSVILFAILLCSLVFICINTIKLTDTANLTPPIYNGVSPLFSAAFHSVTRTLEVTSLMFMGEKVNGKFLPTCFKGLAFFSLAATVLFALISLVTGKYGDVQLFQLYTLTTIAGSGMTEQLDAVIICFWTLCAFVKTAFFIYLSVYSTEEAFSYHAKNICYFLSAGIVCIGAIIISYSTTRFSTVISSRFYEAVFITAVTVLPLLIFIVFKNRNKSKRSVL